MFVRFPNVHTLRLENTPCETDTNFIPPQYQLKTLILVHTMVPPVMAFATPRFNTLVFRADRPTLRFADTFTMYRRRDFEHFVMYSNCLRMVRFDRIVLKGMARKIADCNVVQVNRGPAIGIHNYFPKADFDPYQD
ncbi:hypothetical protein CPB97_008217 [Podila verticillata]|nr:hypothetical protein CPB97_008217 [Podila verticillata]